MTPDDSGAGFSFNQLLQLQLIERGVSRSGNSKLWNADNQLAEADVKSTIYFHFSPTADQ